MADTFERKETQCRAKVGLLSLRDCGKLADTQCSTCGRSICRAHKMIGEQSAIICPECAAQTQKTEVRGTGRTAWRRRRYYDHYGYHPYYYGYHHYWSDRDYRTFDDREVQSHAPASEEAVAAAEAVDADAGDLEDTDFMES